MAFAGRNEACPCGSSRKYKKCCGFDRTLERALEDRLAAVKEIARLAYRSPRLVPASDAYDDWVRAMLAGARDRSVEDAIAVLGDQECARIVAACFELYGDEWVTLAARCGSDREACSALLGGAVTAGIQDFRYPGRFALETVEESEDLTASPIEELGMCLEGDQLWSTDEGLEADRAVGAIPDWVDDEAYEQRWKAILADLAPRLRTDWHTRRLARLVKRIEHQLPFDGFPRATAAIEAGCAAYDSREELRRQLAATLLSDMVGREQLRELRASFAA